MSCGLLSSIAARTSARSPLPRTARAAARYWTLCKMLLALDTCTNSPSIALYAAQGIVGEITWRTREHHTRSLMPEIARLLELVAGPGSFTGLRIGLSAAKGLAYSLNVALLGVPTLDITASAGALLALPLCAAMSTGRGRYAAALYEIRAQTPVRTSDYWFGTAETLAPQIAERVREPFVLLGEMDDALPEQLRAYAGERMTLAPRALQLRRAGFLAELAWRRWQAGERANVETLAPYYVPTAALA
ncbi:MAG: tRNA (adenosine(37)-N6)-threonylcarbamoyltransferase complex dimerization subunit type 1 TsaB [Chloroflexi bacterium]|nr:MAG: tRNA (adenosine(37)-N6)-threonylcarbamoyltransferase complex dimerization subunit type 1 TsaB [Chloroflexota bacterium]